MILNYHQIILEDNLYELFKRTREIKIVTQSRDLFIIPGLRLKKNNERRLYTCSYKKVMIITDVRDILSIKL